MTWFNHVGKLYQYADEFVDNRIEMIKLELSANTSAVISKSVTLLIYLFLGAIIYVLILLIAVFFIDSLLNSMLQTLLLVLGFHILLLVISLRLQKTWFNQYITNYLAVEFTDVENEKATKALSIEEYKNRLKAKNDFILNGFKNDLKSLFFLDKIKEMFAEETPPDGTSEDWSEEQKNAFMDIKNIVEDIFQDTEVVEATKQFSQNENPQ